MSESMTLVLRTLALLRALNKQTHSSLRSLHEATGMPKPTVHRLLATLKNEGYVKSDAVKGLYSLTQKVRLLSDGYTEHELVVELGAPILLRSTRQTGLPLAIGIAERSRMVVRYSSMPYSPVAPMHTTLGNSHPMTQSAMGLAFMAYCSDAERERLLDWLRASARDEAAWNRAAQTLQARIMTIRKQGYALRRPDSLHENATLAVPIRCAGHVLGVLSLTTFDSLLTAKTTRDFVVLLQRTSEEVSAAVAKHDQQAPTDPAAAGIP